MRNILRIFEIFEKYKQYYYRNMQKCRIISQGCDAAFFRYHRSILNILGALLRFPWPEAEEQHFLLAGIENPLCQ